MKYLELTLDDIVKVGDEITFLDGWSEITNPFLMGKKYGETFLRRQFEHSCVRRPIKKKRIG